MGGVYSRSTDRRTRIAMMARDLGLGPAQVFASVEAMMVSGEVDALWLLTPNDTRLDIMREIHRLKKSGAPVRAIACEKPLARNLAEAREMLALAEDAGLLHAARTLSGAALCRRAAALTSRGRPKSIPVRTNPGSGRAKGKAEGSFPT
jgi:predicted dehydrogenase